MSPDSSEELADFIAPRPVVKAEHLHDGMIFDLVAETVDLGRAGQVRREMLRHPGAVTVAALDGEPGAERVLMIRQYRHPVQMELWELPAGLLDVVGEPPLEAAKRELHEEADLKAERWDLVADWFNSPGGSDEALRLYLARDVQVVDEADRHTREAEELDMPSRWVPLEEARDAVLAGKIHNPGSVIGILAVWTARELGWTTLRPAAAPWPEHPRLR
ncbi:NUDIX domain-containing protein [Spongisporangium articulatum]|uniref:NUDIX domain-containing protein n=1 Tax=Spongisporangium articulatum TaxID=3362603 RepID=A0ABW8AUN6_9ACTN